jgi:putative DNA primase/helicase
MADKKSDGAPVDSERNSLKQARPRERKRPIQESTERVVGGASVNAIEKASSRQTAAASAPPAPSKLAGEPERPSGSRFKSTRTDREADSPHPDAMPELIRRRFVQVGRKYYFPDGARAFTDRGHRLTTASENSEVIKSLVEIAKTRGWGDISVHGTERFRREAWTTAKMAGLEVRGYRPTKFEEGKLVRMLAEKASPERRAAPLPMPPGAAREGVPQFVGKLLEHGRAPYKQDPKEPMSYFVRLETSRGERTVWGVDLERAFKESLTQPKAGDEVGLIPARRDAVRINVPERDAKDQVSGQKSLDTYRNRWVVEKQAFFDDRTRAAQTLLNPSVTPKQGVKDHPELVGTYLQVKAAELAATKIRNAADRQQFLERVRGALAEAVARGEPLPRIQMKDKSPTRRTARAAEQAQAR